MKILNISVFDAMISGNKIFVVMKNRDLTSLMRFNKDLEFEEKIVELRGSSCYLLDVFKKQDKYLLGLDNKLVKVENGTYKHILTSRHLTNFFRHAVRVKDDVYVQEYGEQPTGIWSLKNDFTEPVLRVTNIQIDKHSRHFHYVAYDQFRDQLIVTLGDRNLVRAIVSIDEGKTWEPLYRGPWQFVPLVALKDRIIFGMDSGIARGGLGIYCPNENRWEFLFLKWIDDVVRLSQMADLKLLDNNLWVASLGTPQVIVVSKDLRTWYALQIDGLNKQFNHNMNLSTNGNYIICTTGKKLIMLKKNEVKKMMLTPVMMNDDAYTNRIKGLGFTLKRKLVSLTTHL